jgi:hypothetical protein
MRIEVALVVGLGMGGCSSDDPSMAAEGTGDTGDSQAQADSTGFDSTGIEPSTSTDTDVETSSGAAMPIEYARGIRLTRLTANQGVQVELVSEGLEVPPEEQGTRLIAGRRTLLRGFWSLHADFEPRELVGQLTIDAPDGSVIEQEFVVMVDGDSADGGASFQWLLEPDDVVSGMQFRARILEPDPSMTTLQVSDPPPVAPLPGQGTLQVYDAPLELQIVLVPVLHQFEGCETMPEITEQDVEDLRHALEQTNPVQRAFFSVREPMPYTQSIADGPAFTPILVELAKTRTDDDVADNVYYYGLLQSCDGFPSGLGGQAIGIPDAPTRENASQRVSTGRWNGSGAAAARTFVHEIGHSQGRRHVRCSGGEAGIDVNYPHPNGRIGVWGFGIYDFVLRSPTGGRDYMSYCSDRFISDYGWELVIPVIETLTSWDYETGEPQPRATMLYGVLHEDGTQDWWTAPGGLPGSTTGEHTIVYELGGVPITMPSSIQPIPHGSAQLVIAPLPAAPSAITSAWLAPGGGHPSRTIDLHTVDDSR